MRCGCRCWQVVCLALLALVVACGGGVTSAPGGDREQRVATIDGVYTFTVTEKAIRLAGGTVQKEFDENTGRMTFRLHHGTWSMRQVYSQGPKAGTVWHGTGEYRFDGKHVKIIYSHDPGDWTTADVTIRPSDRALVFSNIHDGDGSEEQAISEAWYTVWSRQDR